MLDLLARDVMPLNRGHHAGDLRRNLFHAPPETQRRPRAAPPAPHRPRRARCSRLCSMRANSSRIPGSPSASVRRVSPIAFLRPSVCSISSLVLRATDCEKSSSSCARYWKPAPTSPSRATSMLVSTRSISVSRTIAFCPRVSCVSRSSSSSSATTVSRTPAVACSRLANEFLRRGCQFLHPRQHRAMRSLSAQPTITPCRFENRVRLPRQSLEIVAQPFHLRLRLGQQRAQLARNPAQSRVGRFSFDHEGHAAALGFSCVVANTRRTLLPQRRAISPATPVPDVLLIGGIARR